MLKIYTDADAEKYIQMHMLKNIYNSIK